MNRAAAVSAAAEKDGGNAKSSNWSSGHNVLGTEKSISNMWQESSRTQTSKISENPTVCFAPSFFASCSTDGVAHGESATNRSQGPVAVAIRSTSKDRCSKLSHQARAQLVTGNPRFTKPSSPSP